MARVRKGNRELTVAEHKVDEFVSQGYDYISEEGAILKKGAPISLQDYKERYVEQLKEIKEKNKKIEIMDEKIMQLEVQLEQKDATIEDLTKQIKNLDKPSEKVASKKTASK